ncbi:MAG: 8-oxo-dGTP diphosphatase [Candidatus Paceibacterota bacterium]
MKKVCTLCFIKENDKILLGMKKRGFGQGRWNGFGGKVKEGESIKQGAVREFEEECGMRAIDLEEVGVIDFSFLDNGEKLEVHIFDILKYEGKPSETEEMKPEWFYIKDIPFSCMWPDDTYWMPLFLSGKKIKASFDFDNQDKINKYEIMEI